jgi:hypothetical protein
LASEASFGKKNPYQKWSQKREICAADRFFQIIKLNKTIENMGATICENVKKHLEKVNVDDKKWAKCEFKIKKIPRNQNQLRKKIVEKRKQVLETFEKHKDEIHEEVDPPGLDDLSQIFDVRLWPFMESKETCEDIKNQIVAKIEKADDFFIGEDTEVLESDIRQIIDFIFEKNILANLQKENSIRTQWKSILKHPMIKDCSTFYNCCYRVTTLPNSEAGCEQSNSKYNRAKDQYASVMSTEMIQTRMRVGSNGPPLHLFDAESVRIYWKANGHRLAQKVAHRANPESKVIKRIRDEQNRNYTSKIFSKKFSPY